MKRSEYIDRGSPRTVAASAICRDCDWQRDRYAYNHLQKMVRDHVQAERHRVDVYNTRHTTYLPQGACSGGCSGAESPANRLHDATFERMTETA